MKITIEPSFAGIQKFPKKKKEWDEPSRKEKDKKKDYSKERERKRGMILDY